MYFYSCLLTFLANRSLLSVSFYLCRVLFSASSTSTSTAAAKDRMRLVWVDGSNAICLDGLLVIEFLRWLFPGRCFVS